GQRADGDGGRARGAGRAPRDHGGRGRGPRAGRAAVEAVPGARRPGRAAQVADAMIHGLLSRRHFLRRLGVAVGATLGTSPLAELAAVAAPAPVHVVIAGAGLAGLCAALELERRGHTCTILEAETRHVGGRARTLRFEGGLYGEAGAMRIPKTHTLTRHYVAELGLTPRPFVQSNPEAFVFMRGRRERMHDVTKLGARYGLAPGEQGKLPDDLWAASLGRRLEAMTT